MRLGYESGGRDRIHHVRLAASADGIYLEADVMNAAPTTVMSWQNNFYII